MRLRERVSENAECAWRQTDRTNNAPLADGAREWH